MRHDFAKIVSEYIGVPDHVKSCANAIRYDILHGPSWSLIPSGDITKFNDDCLATYYDDLVDEVEPGDIICQTYGGVVSDTLREFIDNMPSELWIDTQCDFVTETEPDQFEDCEECNEAGVVDCEECNGMGETNGLDCEECNGAGVVDCEECGGSGYVSVDLSDWYYMERKEIVECLFGRTLAEDF